MSWIIFMAGLIVNVMWCMSIITPVFIRTLILVSYSSEVILFFVLNNVLSLNRNVCLPLQDLDGCRNVAFLLSAWWSGTTFSLVI